MCPTLGYVVPARPPGKWFFLFPQGWGNKGKMGFYWPSTVMGLPALQRVSNAIKPRIVGFADHMCSNICLALKTFILALYDVN